MHAVTPDGVCRCAIIADVPAPRFPFQETTLRVPGEGDINKLRGRSIKYHDSTALCIVVFAMLTRFHPVLVWQY